jgi:arabinofuranan 3-O-arabinosyltransferase
MAPPDGGPCADRCTALRNDLDCVPPRPDSPPNDAMAIDALPTQRPASLQLSRPVELTCIALAMAQAVALAASFVQGTWLIDADGQAIATDFVNVWAGGRQALDGHPEAAYDVDVQKAAEVAALGHNFAGEYPWVYPPTFLLVAAPLALIPFVPAYAIWVFATFPAYVAAIRAIIGYRVGILLACAYPGVLSNAMVGQNGFLTAALLGGFLITLQRSPLLAGAMLGLLAFKPHLGVLIPLALIVGGYWRAIAAATAVVALTAAASARAFGLASWTAFFQALPTATQATLADGRGDFGKLQSVFTLVRWLGGGETLAWTLHGALAAAVAIAVCVLWRRRSKTSFEMKAAALATGALLVTPYLYLYDLVVLAVPMAFLIRAGAQRGFLPGEVVGLGIASLLILIFPLVKAPVGLAAIFVVGALIIRRIRAGDAGGVRSQDDSGTVQTAS